MLRFLNWPNMYIAQLCDWRAWIYVAFADTMQNHFSKINKFLVKFHFYSFVDLFTD